MSTLCFSPRAKPRRFHSSGREVRQSTYLSVGGGFVVTAGAENAQVIAAAERLPYQFSSGKELLELCEKNSLSIAQLMLQNELTWRSETEIFDGLQRIWNVMQACVDRGCKTEGHLPGPLKVKRRAAHLYQKLIVQEEVEQDRSLGDMDWLNLFALAVNEENAGGGRVVTAPTNGAAGIIPAVLHFYVRFTPNSRERGVYDFLLAAAAIGTLYKLNASISGAEVGCQGEVGVACSMAAGGLPEHTTARAPSLQRGFESGYPFSVCEGQAKRVRRSGFACVGVE